MSRAYINFGEPIYKIDMCDFLYNTTETRPGFTPLNVQLMNLPPNPRDLARKKGHKHNGR